MTGLDRFLLGMGGAFMAIVGLTRELALEVRRRVAGWLA